MPRKSKITVDRLKRRLTTRGRANGKVFVLDLRHSDFGRLGRMTVLDPSDPKWPNGGRAAKTRAEADKWLENYVTYIRNEIAKRTNGTDLPATVTQACDKFIADLEADARYGPEHNTVANYRSAYNVHVKPAFGALPLTALSTARVRQFLDNLKVTKSRHGQEYKEAASHRTKTNVRAALQALWRHFDKDNPPPFGTIVLKNTDRPNLRAAALRGDILAEEERDAYSPEDVLTILAYAMIEDREKIASLPHVAVRVIPNTAEVIALQLAFATRIEELTFMRWKHVDLEYDMAWIPGTKNESAPRWVPLQTSAGPWFQRLRNLNPEAMPEDFLLRVDPRPHGRSRRPAVKTYQGRIGRVLMRAGLKMPQKLTHIFRATHRTWALGNGYNTRRLDMWMGHVTKGEEIPRLYTSRAQVARMMHPADRTYLPMLPSPEECEARAAEILQGVVE